MNYITRLRREANRTEAWLTDFEAHLLSDKFTGTEPSGERKDWIAVADVLRWLELLKSEHI